jgi:chitodextrinase
MPKFRRPRVAPRNDKTQNIESLEGRRLFAVSIGSDGWTDITPSSDSRVVYVSSSSGSDSNSGLSSSAPLKTVGKARTLLRDGSPDWMLLKRGDAWSESLTNWTLSGRNSQEPMLIGAYGSGERPVLNTGTGIGFKNSDPVSHLAINGIYFHANSRDTESSSYSGTTTGNYGFHTMGNLTDVLVEDSVFDDYTYNMSVTAYNGAINDFRMRRSIVTDAWSTSGKAQGMYIDEVNGLLLEGNLFDHNGWNSDVSGAGANIYSHGVYMSARNDNVVIRGNIFSDSSSHGLMARAGGVIENNLFLRNPINLTFGGGASVTAGGVTGRVSGNVILDSRDIAGSKRGIGIEIANTKPGANVVVEGNIITGDTQRNTPAITFNNNSDASNISEAVGINDLTIRDNIVYDWYSGWNLSSSFNPGGSGYNAVNNLKVQDNDFQNTAIDRLVKEGTGVSSEIAFSNNRYNDGSSNAGWFMIGSTTSSLSTWKSKVEPTAVAEAASYASPTRSIATYNAAIGGSTSFSDFVADAADQRQGNYDSAYSAAAVINYIRQGFAEGGIVPGGLLPVNGGGSVPSETDPTPPPTGDTYSPSSPSTLRATGASDTTVGMTWNASSDNVGVAGYEIFRSGTLIATVAGTSYTDTGLNPSTSYVYTVRAFDAAGNRSGMSNTDTGTTLASSSTPAPSPTDTTAPTTPSSFSAGGASDTTVTMQWAASSDNVGVAGYEIFRDGTLIGTTTATSYTDTGLAPSTRYVYTVRAYDAAGNRSAMSNSDGGTTFAPASTADTTAPAAPASLATGAVTTSTIAMSWTAATDNVGVTGYRVFRNGVQVGTTTGTTYTDTGLAAGTSYAYTVKAYDAAGNVSAASNSATGTTTAAPVPTTAPAAPTSLTGSRISSRKARLTWTDKSSDELGFYVYTSTDGVNWTRYATVAATSGSGASVQYTSGRLTGTHYFRVASYNAAGESAPTNTVQLSL